MCAGMICRKPKSSWMPSACRIRQLKPYDMDNPEKVFMEDEILALIDEEESEERS